MFDLAIEHRWERRGAGFDSFAALAVDAEGFASA